MAQKKSFQELDLNNAFMFAAAMEDGEICRLVLEIILGESIGPVQVKTERNILFCSDFRCIRLDVYAKDTLNVGYNLEMQNRDEKNLPKRSRYHQAEIDMSSLKPGQDFQDLNPNIIVFICTFDPFGRKRYRYTFEQRCVEEDFPLGDGTKRIFLSTKGENDKEVSESLIHFLHYVNDSTDSYVNQIGDSAIDKLHEKVKRLKKSRELEERYMTVEELLKEEYKEGKIQTLKLVACMAENGETELISRLEEDEVFFETMLQKYEL